jgi:hypothetical protein
MLSKQIILYFSFSKKKQQLAKNYKSTYENYRFNLKAIKNISLTAKHDNAIPEGKFE